MVDKEEISQLLTNITNNLYTYVNRANELGDLDTIVLAVVAYSELLDRLMVQVEPSIIFTGMELDWEVLSPEEISSLKSRVNDAITVLTEGLKEHFPYISIDKLNSEDS